MCASIRAFDRGGNAAVGESQETMTSYAEADDAVFDSLRVFMAHAFRRLATCLIATQ